MTREASASPAGRDIRSAKLSPDGELVLTTGELCIVWDANTGQKLSTLDKPQYTEWNVGEFSPDSKKVVTATPDGSRVWDARSGEKLLELTPGRIFNAAFSPDGRQIFTAGEHDIELRDAQSGGGDCYPKGAPVIRLPASAGL